MVKKIVKSNCQAELQTGEQKVVHFISPARLGHVGSFLPRLASQNGSNILHGPQILPDGAKSGGQKPAIHPQMPLIKHKNKERKVKRQ